MNRRRFLKTAVLTTTGLLTSGCVSRVLTRKSEKRPNILIVNIDDMGYGDMSGHGNPVLKTPNLDRLHTESVRFTQFHVAPMCTPTRGQLMTGVDALKNGSRWVGTEDVHLRTDIPTMGEIFKDAGYRTGLFGKWHIGDNYPMRPQDRGFEETVWFPQQEIGTVNDYWDNDYFDDTYEHNGVPTKYEGFCTDVWFRLAIEWMGKMSVAEERFLCCIPTNVTHGPYFAPQKYRDIANIKNQPRDAETFFATMINLDDNIGNMLDFLDQSGLRDNTILIFMTDNGVTMGYNTYNAGMRGMKTQLWEGGHRVPLFVRWPDGGISTGRDINELAQVQDILPTLLDFCGIKAPANVQFDGISLAEQISGTAEMPDRILVVQFQRTNEIKKYDACIMWGPWRLLNAINADPKETPEKRKIYQQRMRNYEIHLELFNIKDDPHQDNNVISEHPDVVSKMLTHYEKWWESVQPHLEINQPILIGNDAENPMMLSAASWATTYFTQKKRILEGNKANGFWNLVVDAEGTYQFELRRWPKETNAALQDAVGVKYTDDYPYGPGMDGKSLNIASAKIKIAEHEEKIEIKKGDKAAVFNLRLNKGPTKLKTWFYDKDGNELCGAYYVYIERI